MEQGYLKPQCVIVTFEEVDIVTASDEKFSEDKLWPEMEV